MTIVGVIVTSTGILLAADTAMTSSTESSRVIQKVEITGTRSGAAMNGSTLLLIGNVTIDFHDVFRSVARELRTAGAVPVAEQARRFGEALRLEAQRKRDPAITREIEKIFREPDAGLTVTVAGYDNGQPQIIIATVAMDADATAKAGTVQFVARRLVPNIRCMSFSGKIGPAEALRLDDPRLPLSLRSNVGVRRIQELIRNCFGIATTGDAIEFFKSAVQATVDYGKLFGISPGVVNWPIDVLTIPPTGTPRLERISGAR